jgi:hypothetical protein
VCCNATCESFVRTGSYALRPIAERRRCTQRRVASLCESEDTYGKSSWADPRERPARVFYPLFLSVIRRKFRERTSNLLTSSLCFSTLPNDREPARKESRGRGGKHVKNRNRLDLSGPPLVSSTGDAEKTESWCVMGPTGFRSSTELRKAVVCSVELVGGHEGWNPLWNV